MVQLSLRMREPIELPSLESLPQTVCRVCLRSKINGLFTPRELACTDGYPRCRKCIGEISDKSRAHSRRGLDR